MNYRIKRPKPEVLRARKARDAIHEKQREEAIALAEEARSKAKSYQGWVERMRTIFLRRQDLPRGQLRKWLRSEYGEPGGLCRRQINRILRPRRSWIEKAWSKRRTRKERGRPGVTPWPRSREVAGTNQ